MFIFSPVLAVLAFSYVVYWLFGPVKLKHQPMRSKAISTTESGGEIRRAIEHTDALVTTPEKLPHCETVPQLLRTMIEQYGSQPILRTTTHRVRE